MNINLIRYIRDILKVIIESLYHTSYFVFFYMFYMLFFAKLDTVCFSLFIYENLAFLFALLYSLIVSHTFLEVRFTIFTIIIKPFIFYSESLFTFLILPYQSNDKSYKKFEKSLTTLSISQFG